VIWRGVLPVIAIAAMSGCSVPEPGTLALNEAYDPFEEENRERHEFNKSLDRGVVRPLGKGYGFALPDPVEAGISNFGDNLNMPGVAVNSTLQGDLKGLGLATVRFVVNTTVGIGGLFDPASAMGIPDHDTDFGETLHVWGAPEGAYLELPLIGPSTERDAVGTVVDVFTNPLLYAFKGSDRGILAFLVILSGLGDRSQFSDTVDSVLYESADSYAQSRLIYLQNRRFKLGQDEGGETGTDPYDDLYTDPYEDPYAE
jgi:phospholipid-binding lipoprotein MlaA